KAHSTVCAPSGSVAPSNSDMIPRRCWPMDPLLECREVALSILKTRRIAAPLLHLGIGQRSVYRWAAEMVHCRLPAAEHSLGHSDEDEVVCRIDPEPCGGSSLPVKRPLADDLVGGRRVVVHRKVVAPPMSRPHHRLSDREFTAQQPGRKVIRGHQ